MSWLSDYRILRRDAVEEVARLRAKGVPAKMKHKLLERTDCPMAERRFFFFHPRVVYPIKYGVAVAVEAR